MGKIIMVTGGARSGKSRFAEKMAAGLGESIVYIATSIAFDDEMKDRIKKHRSQRPVSWRTVEAYKDFDCCLANHMEGMDGAVLDCLTLMVSNIMLEKDMEWVNTTPDEINKVENTVKEEVSKLIHTAQNAPFPFIIVTNELGMGLVPSTILGRAMRDIAGRMNQMLAHAAEEAYLCVSGLQIRIK
jgi:adenosylcobinamide kinase/adenosylcobinamide-phosphate guanylyltransferase